MHQTQSNATDESKDQLNTGDSRYLDVTFESKYVSLLEAEAQEPETSEPKHKQYSSFMVFAIMLLSTTEGFNTGYMTGLMEIFREEGVSSDQIGMLTLITFPLLLCLLGGPIVDRYYSDRLGKRRTYLLPGKVLVGLGYAIFSFYIDEAVAQQKIKLITWVLIAIGSIQFFDFNALLGLRFEVFGPKNSGMASFTLFTGIVIGHFFGHTMFVLLNSKYFCQELLHLSSDKLFTHQMLLLLYAGISLLAALVTLGIKETSSEAVRKNDEGPSMNTFTMIRIMLCDPVVRKATLWVLYSGYALAALKAANPQMLIHKGMRREHVVMMDGAKVPFLILGNWFMNRYVVPGTIMRRCCKLMILALGLYFIDLLNVLTFDSKNQYWLGLVFYMGSNALSCFLPYVSYQMAFVNSISHPEHAASFATTMLGLMNFGKVIPVTVTVSLLDFLPFTALFLILCLSNILILLTTYNNVVRQIDEATVKAYHEGIDAYRQKSTDPDSSHLLIQQSGSQAGSLLQQQNNPHEEGSIFNQGSLS